MNLELLESFGQNFPEESDGCLDCGATAITVAFNRWGSLLAVGSADGRVFIFDFITRGVAKTLAAHVQPVCSLSWSRNGRRLLTASADNTAALYDVLSGECERRFRFPSPILRLQFHPKDSRRFIVCPMRMGAVLVNAKEGTHVSLPTDDADAAGEGVVASFERKGRYILTGNAKGKVCLYSAEDLTLAGSFRLAPQGAATSHPIKSIEAARKGDYFVTNSNDRIIRVYDIREVLLRPKAPSLEPIQKLQDLVNRTPWKTVCLSGDGEYVCAGSAKSHSLYIWERKAGSLVKILSGTKGELLLDLQWHPARPLICSVSNGLVSIWSQAHVENWSAFAPDFKELDENVEYEERESEFDLEDEDGSVDEAAEAGGRAAGGEEEIDVTTVHNPSMDSDSEPESSPAPAAKRRKTKSRETSGRNSAAGGSVAEEEEPPLWFLPVAPDVDAPEDAEAPPLTATAAEAPADAAPNFEISLLNAPTDEMQHPLIAGSGRKRSSLGSAPTPRSAQPKAKAKPK